MVEREVRAQFREVIVHTIKTTYATVWAQFPPELQPNIEGIESRIRVGPLKAKGRLRIHPKMNPANRAEIQQELRRLEREKSLKQVTLTDYKTGTTTFHEALYDSPELQVRGVVFHAIADSCLITNRVIPPQYYTEWQKSRAIGVLEHLFSNVKHRPRIEETEIRKFGFRELLMAQGSRKSSKKGRSKGRSRRSKKAMYAVSDLYSSPYILDLNQLFPVGFEIVTDQILTLGGDIQAFDVNLALGMLSSRPHEDHPIFAIRFFELAKEIGWRLMLTSLLSGDINTVVSSFDTRLPGRGDEALDYLLTAMYEDEKTLTDIGYLLQWILRRY